jgi:hypothetical protein
VVVAGEIAILSGEAAIPPIRRDPVVASRRDLGDGPIGR